MVLYSNVTTHNKNNKKTSKSINTWINTFSSQNVELYDTKITDLTCDSGKGTDVPNNINNGSVLFKWA